MVLGVAAHSSEEDAEGEGAEEETCNVFTIAMGVWREISVLSAITQEIPEPTGPCTLIEDECQD